MESDNKVLDDLNQIIDKTIQEVQEQEGVYIKECDNIADLFKMVDELFLNDLLDNKFTVTIDLDKQ